MSGAPPIAKTSFSAFVAAIAPKRSSVVDERREEVDGEHDRALVVQPVDGRVVGGVEPDEQILRFRRVRARRAASRAEPPSTWPRSRPHERGR